MGGERDRDEAPGPDPGRPLTHDLFATTLEELGARIDRVVITSSPRRRSTPGSCSSATAGRSRSTPGRRTRSRWRSGPGVRIFAAEAVLEQAALGADGGIGDDEGEEGSPLESTGEQVVDPRLDVFRDFVNSLDVDAEGESRSS